MDISAAEEKSACADSIFTTLLEKGIDGIFVVQSDGAIVYANKQIQTLLGFSLDELLAIPYQDLFVHEQKIKNEERIRSAFLNDKGFERYESEMAAKDGRLVSVEISLIAAVWRGIPARVVFARDVTTRKKGDIDIQKNIDRYRELSLIVERSFEAIVITDPQGIIQYVNDSWERLNGWTGEEVVGKVTPRVIKSGVQNAAFYEAFWRTLLDGNIVEQALTNKRKDGTLYEAEISVMPLKNDMGVITGFAGFQRDVTARNKAQKQLMEEKKFSEDIIERANAIVVVIDPQGIVTRFNQKAEEVTGYTKEEIIGKSLFETIFPLDKYPLIRSEFMYTGGERGMTKRFESAAVTKAGDVYILDWSVSELSRDDRMIAIISFGTNVTDQKRMEADLIEKNNDLERFKDLMVGRELKMIELKKEIDALKNPAVHAEKNIN